MYGKKESVVEPGKLFILNLNEFVCPKCGWHTYPNYEKCAFCEGGGYEASIQRKRCIRSNTRPT